MMLSSKPLSYLDVSQEHRVALFAPNLTSTMTDASELY